MICYKYVLKCPGDLRSNRYINDLAAVCNSLLFCHFAFAARKRVFTPKYYSVGSEPKISKPRFSGEFPLFRPCAFDLVCQVFKSYAFLFFSKSQYGCVLLTDIRRKMRRLLKRLFPRVSGGDAFSAPPRALEQGSFARQAARAYRNQESNTHQKRDFSNILFTFSPGYDIINIYQFISVLFALFV